MAKNLLRGAAIELIKSAEMMQARSDKTRITGGKIAFVPTMGFLHEGHLSLMRKGRNLCDELIVSIFVNPTQFAPGEDLDSYPRSLERDLELCEKNGVNAVYEPPDGQLYPDGFQTYLTLDDLPHHLCGLQRPIHFRGVATVVAKLFNIVKPHWAIFGEKDFQQVQVIKRMAKDLNYDIEILTGPTVREADGLAMSSRNAYLNDRQRKDAVCVHKSLLNAQEQVNSGERDAQKILEQAVEFIKSFDGTDIDYIKICNPETLEDVEAIEGPVLMALAVKFDKTRLIDNMTIGV